MGRNTEVNIVIMTWSHQCYHWHDPIQDTTVNNSRRQNPHQPTRRKICPRSTWSATQDGGGSNQSWRDLRSTWSCIVSLLFFSADVTSIVIIVIARQTQILWRNRQDGSIGWKIVTLQVTRPFTTAIGLSVCHFHPTKWTRDEQVPWVRPSAPLLLVMCQCSFQTTAQQWPHSSCRWCPSSKARQWEHHAMCEARHFHHHSQPINKATNQTQT